MTCDPTNSTGINAKSGQSCDGVCGTAAGGCNPGSPMSPSGEASVLQMFSRPIVQRNGSKETKASQATGDDHRTPTWLPVAAFALACCFILAMCGVKP